MPSGVNLLILLQSDHLLEKVYGVQWATVVPVNTGSILCPTIIDPLTRDRKSELN